MVGVISFSTVRANILCAIINVVFMRNITIVNWHLASVFKIGQYKSFCTFGTSGASKTF